MVISVWESRWTIWEYRERDAAPLLLPGMHSLQHHTKLTVVVHTSNPRIQEVEAEESTFRVTLNDSWLHTDFQAHLGWKWERTSGEWILLTWFQVELF